MRKPMLLFDIEPKKKTRSEIGELEKALAKAEQKLERAILRVDALESELDDARELQDELEELVSELEELIKNANNSGFGIIPEKISWLYPPAIPATQYEIILPTPILWLDRVRVKEDTNGRTPITLV